MSMASSENLMISPFAAMPGMLICHYKRSLLHVKPPLSARLEGEGVTIEVPYQEQSGLSVKRAVIVDPVGTRIELTNSSLSDW